jgi:outer membrane immunogenic protein
MLAFGASILPIGDAMGRISSGITLFVITVVASWSSSAMAADIPAPVYKAPMLAPVASWTGFYAGLNAGAAFGHLSEAQSLNAPECDGPACPALIAFISTGHKLNSTGFTGGGQIGYNQQFNNFVFGLEADFEAMRLSKSFAFGPTVVFPGIPAAASGNGSLSTNWLLTVRPRVGVAFDRALFYVTGGLAVTDANFSEAVTATGQPGVVIGQYGLAASATRVGYAVGGGFEYMLGGGWSAKAEYLHLDFGNLNTVAFVSNVPAGGGGLGASALSMTSHLSADIVRAGVNYHFGGPVVAKY